MAINKSSDWENLPQELITEVLLRLPVKSLLKFLCVSKSWLSLILSPRFRSTYLNCSASRPRLAFHSSTGLRTCSLGPKFDEDPSVDNVPLGYFANAKNQDYSFWIVGSCNGLVCLAHSRRDSVVVWNPTTRKHRLLPDSPENGSFWLTYGFGYDATNDDYKLVGFRQINTPQIRIYSLRNESWKISNWSHRDVYGDGVFLNGALHWTGCNAYDTRNWNVVALNLTTESCWSIAVPVSAHGSRIEFVWLGALGDCLCLSFDRPFSMDVWVMREYGVEESWSKMVCIPYLFYTKDVGSPTREPPRVPADVVVVMNTDLKLMLHRPFRYDGFADGVIDVQSITYVESLVSPYLEQTDWCSSLHEIKG